MSIRYHTGTATLIQFISLSLFGVAHWIASIITACRTPANECTEDSVVSFIFFLLTVLWFGSVWILGYLAQERRSRYLAYLLIGVEIVIIMVANVNIGGNPDRLSLTTSLVDIGLALWVIYLAIRLSRAKGGRIMTSQRKRQRTIKNQTL